MYHELEQFLGRGEEKAVWLLSVKNIGGLIGGGILGQRLGTALFGSGALVLLCTVLGAVLGITLTFQHHGLLILRRLVIRARFYLQRAIRPRVVDAEAIFPVVTRPDVVIRVERPDGTPVIVPERITR
jgi:hypothetical protein